MQQVTDGTVFTLSHYPTLKKQLPTMKKKQFDNDLKTLLNTKPINKMKKITVGSHNYYWHEKTRKLYFDAKKTKPVPTAYFDYSQYREFLKAIQP